MITSLPIKHAKTTHNIHPLIAKRWSARSFSEKSIDPAILSSTFEAASWASSSMNEQPWEYWYVTKKDAPKFDLFSSLLMDGNKSWAKHADVLILCLAHKNFEKNGQFNRHYMHDCGAANTNLLLQAAEFDIYGHMLGGFHMDKTIETLAISDQLEPVCFIALGYLDAPEKLEEPFLTRELSPRSRKEQSLFVRSF